MRVSIPLAFLRPPVAHRSNRAKKKEKKENEKKHEAETRREREREREDGGKWTGVFEGSPASAGC
jgi:ribosomal protein L12E/L44/L45/RPP1/RPP2